jgi:hypothetical protein
MTWLYVPDLPPPSTSAPASDCSSSSPGSPGSAPKLWVTLSGTATQRPHSWPGWTRRPWTRRLFGTISRPLTAQRGVDEWISSLPVSLANRSAQPGKVEVSMTSDGSGQTLPGSLLTWDRATCSWRTSPDLFGPGSLTSSPTLPSSGSMRSGAVSPRPPLAPLIDGSGSGSGQPWATPRARWRPAAIRRAHRSAGARASSRPWPTPRRDRRATRSRNARAWASRSWPPERDDPADGRMAAQAARPLLRREPDGATGRLVRPRGPR